ncbi:hypothetical protein [Agrobacterium vitis]|uniref:hypothetical protein n=1 Tax=Agrobacterium vitis TaxID=373 RepID=UPI003B519DC3
MPARNPQSAIQPTNYHFQVFALDIDTLGLDPGAKRDAILAAMEGHVLGKGRITGKFARDMAAK